MYIYIYVYIYIYIYMYILASNNGCQWCQQSIKMDGPVNFPHCHTLKLYVITGNIMVDPGTEYTGNNIQPVDTLYNVD